MNTYYKINIGTISFENYGNETVAINFVSGVYYSLTGDSNKLWSLIQANNSVEQIASYFIRTKTASAELISNEVNNFIQQLKKENIIIEDILPNSIITENSFIKEKETSFEKEPFNRFEIKIYTDMQDLLLLDPIHDEEDSVWSSNGNISKKI